MALIKIHGGDFEGHGTLIGDTLRLRAAGTSPNDPFEQLTLTDLKSVELVTEESAGSILSALGLGLLGRVIVGPLGLAAGLLIGSAGRRATFAATFNDGRKVLATTSNSAFVKLKAAVF